MPFISDSLWNTVMGLHYEAIELVKLAKAQRLLSLAEYHNLEAISNNMDYPASSLYNPKKKAFEPVTELSQSSEFLRNEADRIAKFLKGLYFSPYVTKTGRTIKTAEVSFEDKLQVDFWYNEYGHLVRKHWDKIIKKKGGE